MKTTSTLICFIGVLLVLAGGSHAATILNTGTGSTYTYQQNLNNTGSQVLTDTYFNDRITYYPAYTDTNVYGAHLGPDPMGNADEIMALKVMAPDGYQINTVSLNFSYKIVAAWWTPGAYIGVNFWSYDPGYWTPESGNVAPYGTWSYLSGTELLHYTAEESTGTVQWANLNLADYGFAGGTNTVMMIFSINPRGDNHWIYFDNSEQLFVTGNDGTPGLTATMGVSAIPEPTTLGLLALGGLALLRRRRS